MNPVLRNRLLAVGGAGAIAIAGVLGKWYEGRMHTVYIDPVGVPTVCDGITGPDVIRGKRYSDAECDALHAKHLAIAEAAVKRQIPGYDGLNDWQKAALIDWAYNFGETKLAASTLRSKFNDGDIDGGCNELLLWVNGRVKGKLVKLRGLVDRRGSENEICLHWGR